MIKPILIRLITCGMVSLVLPACVENPRTPNEPPPATSQTSSESSPSINLLTQADFEAGRFEDWRTDGAVVSSDEARTGSGSARLNGLDQIEKVLETSVGVEYKLTAWVKIASETGDDWGGFRFAALDPDWQELATSGALLTSTYGQDWFKVAFSFKATTEQTRLQIGYFGGPERSMIVYVDDIAVFPKGENQPPTLHAALDPLALNGLPLTQTYSVVSDDPDGAITRVLWDFGDGARALDANGSRRVALPGSYVATVYVADDEGAVSAQTISWTATERAFPDLNIDSLAEGETIVDAPLLQLQGSGSSEVEQVLLSTDRGEATSAEGTTAWSATLRLQPGLNRVLAQARARDGRIVATERLVRYAPEDPLQIDDLTEQSTSVERWDVFEVTFKLANSAATHPQFPYEPAPPPGLEWVDGVTVDGLFTPDNWQTIYRRPAFLHQPYERALKDDAEWLYPVGEPVWTVRFAPPEIGEWQYRIEVREAKGEAHSDERSYTVVAPSNPHNYGPIRVAPNDSRYFEHADGKTFLGLGHGTGFSTEQYSFDALAMFDTIGTDNQNFLRWWISGRIWGSAWQPWSSRTLNNDGYIPATGLTTERAYGDGLVSLQLDANNPLMFQGFMSGHTGLVPERTYRLRVRWRTDAVTGPAEEGQPYGVTAKFTGWPEPGQTADLPALIPHVGGDTPWHIAEADFVAESDLLPNLALILENSTGGAAYVDEAGLYEVQADGSLGPQLLRTANFNAHQTFDQRRGAGIDAILAEAAARGIAFKLVISEKNDYLLNLMAEGGLPDPQGRRFFGAEGSAIHRLHTYYWRHVFARFGAYRSVHSWELVNEAAPGPGAHFQLAAALASAAAADGNPHLATISTWATLSEDAWKAPESAALSYVDFHAYVQGTGWIEPKAELAADTARFFHEYDMAASAAAFGKPVVWGEQGVDGMTGADHEAPELADDTAGVWLHKLTWARTGPGGVYPLYWYTGNIFEHSLHDIFGAWRRFMADITLNNGSYVDAAAAASHPAVRVMGQKDLEHGRAHLWIDNRQHTWRAVVNEWEIPAVSATVSIAMQQPGATYTVVWYDTATGAPSATEQVTADASGALALTVADLQTDRAVQINVRR
ncbi:MAG: PKD domain-containing protein [Chloroflexales bacterium]|nr:PKD domain-containing protein [Chloroflexales bacterium]